FSSNLDEFFQVRVAGLLGQAEAGLAVRSADGLTPQQALARIRERVLELTAHQSRLWKRDLRTALAAGGRGPRRSGQVSGSAISGLPWGPRGSSSAASRTAARRS